MIRIDPFFHGARRKTELVGKPIHFDLGLRGHISSAGLRSSQGSWGKPCCAFTPWWYHPLGGRRKPRSKSTNFRMCQEVAFLLSGLHAAKPGRNFGSLLVSDTCVRSPEFQARCGRSGGTEGNCSFSSLRVASHPLAKLAGMPMLVEVSTEVDSRVVNLSSQQ